MPITEAEFAVLKSQVETQKERLHILEQKIDQELKDLREEIKDSNRKLDEIKDMLNQAKGAGQAVRLVWIALGALAGLIAWAFKTGMH